jgi:NAD(P)-dependent dehydrogenase (short-subunit alcohol dehydrogenase family)
MHEALTAGRGAVITGAASGIGLAASKELARLGLKVLMADVSPDLASAADGVRALARDPGDVEALVTDVSRREDVDRLRDRAIERFGDIAFLMNNAGTEGGGQLFGDPERWRRILEVNLWGVINGVQSFGPALARQTSPAVVVNTGSKQGITMPPGDTAYNVSKAGVKAVTEALAHEFRSTEGCRATAHLLIPGFTFTGFTRVRTPVKPDAAWTPEQVVAFMLDALDRGDFYILCPDNDVTREMDEKRIRWAAGDIVENRPALSRWHPDWKDAFARYMEE